jgi:multidrug efflux pump subunit AcrA (membrane-fusion protein)
MNSSSSSAFIRVHLRFLPFLLLAGCARTTAQPPAVVAPAPDAAPPAVVLPVGPAEWRSLTRAVEQPGRVEPFAQTPLHAKVPGFVRAIHKDIGDEVAAGTPLAEIAVPELEQELAQKQALVAQAAAEVEQAKRLLAAAEANVGSAESAVAEAKAGRARVRANFDRWKSESQRVAGLVERRVIDEQTRDETFNQLRSAEAALEEVEARVRSAQAAQVESTARRDKARADVTVAEAKARVAAADEGRVRALLAYTHIAAPFKGVVTARSVDVGHFLQPSVRDEPLFVVTQADPVRVFVDVPEADAAFVRPGAAVEVRVQALRGRRFPGRVTRTAWALDAKARTLRTAIDLSNPDGTLRPGMYAYAALTVTLPEAWTLPAAAVVHQGDATHAFLVRDGKAVRAEVQTGHGDGTRVEVFKVEAPSAGSGTAWVEVTGKETFVLHAAGVSDGQAVGGK